jgi:hypothetical protein
MFQISFMMIEDKVRAPGARADIAALPLRPIRPARKQLASRRRFFANATIAGS